MQTENPESTLNMVSFVLNLAEQHWEVNVAKTELESVHRPLLQEIAQKAAATKGRFLVLIAGPPGCGKTTLGALWEALAHEMELQIPIVTLPMDGFHLPNVVLDARTIARDGQTIPLRKIKGAPESFDLPLLTKSLQAIRAGKELAWPKYDRQRHDPVFDAISVFSAGILLVEGNYLLLDEPEWRDLKTLADFTIFIEGDADLARESLLARSIRGGRSPEHARQHYEFNESRNGQRVMQRRLASDVVLRVAANRGLIRLK